MEFIIALILIIIVLIIVGLVLRKGIYDKVDFYEKWKIDLMSRNVAEELSKIKALNLEGETKEKFEQWKENWDTIVTDELSEVEELLYDAEQAADKYRVKKANNQFPKMEAKLQFIESQISEILEELDAFIEVEQSTREEIDHLKPTLHTYKKELTQNRYKYEKAIKRFEKVVADGEALLESYDEATAAGNYNDAKEQKEQLKEMLDLLEEEMEAYPTVFKRCQTELPADLSELLRGIDEMKEEGYYLEHLNLEDEIKTYQKQLEQLILDLETESVQYVKDTSDEIAARIEEIYTLLEEEVLAKNFVDSKLSHYEQVVQKFDGLFEQMKNEVEVLQEAYYFEDDDLEKYRNLERNVEANETQLAQFKEIVEEKTSPFSTIRTELEDAFVQLEKMDEDFKVFTEYIQTLRKDELEAMEKHQTLTDTISKTNRSLKGSNLPGIPSHIWDLLEDASAKNERLQTALEQKPLDMVEIKEAVEEAKIAVQTLNENTEVTLDQADLTEKVIQYANRYRSKSASLASTLEEAEQLFHEARYDESLELAAKAIEAIEPGALKKIEQIQEQLV